MPPARLTVKRNAAKLALGANILLPGTAALKPAPTYQVLIAESMVQTTPVTTPPRMTRDQLIFPEIDYNKVENTYAGKFLGFGVPVAIGIGMLLAGVENQAVWLWGVPDGGSNPLVWERENEPGAGWTRTRWRKSPRCCGRVRC